MPFPLIIAHRGERGRRENTVAGFLAGIARGADWIELDVHETADGEFIVWHDFQIRTRPVADCTLRQARALARLRRRIEVPTLEEVLAVLPETVGVNVEIKAARRVRRLLAVLRQASAVERVICSSFDFPIVAQLAELRPRVKTGLLSSSRLPRVVQQIRRARAQALFQEHRVADRRLVREVQQAGFQFFVWTANRPGDLRRMVELGVDGIITDYPDRLVRLRFETTNAHR